MSCVPMATVTTRLRSTEKTARKSPSMSTAEMVRAHCADRRWGFCGRQGFEFFDDFLRAHSRNYPQEFIPDKLRIAGREAAKRASPVFPALVARVSKPAIRPPSSAPPIWKSADTAGSETSATQRQRRDIFVENRPHRITSSRRSDIIGEYATPTEL